MDHPAPPTTTGESLVRTGSRTLGPGLSCGPIGFGCWRFTHADTATAQHLVEVAIGAGMNLVDTADVYGLDWGGSGFGTVEEALGRVLAAAPGLRDQMVLATKGGIVPPVPYDSSAAWLRQACEDSLRRLHTEVIDLYQVHRPDLFADPREVADALVDLIEAGLVRAVGVSNHTTHQHEVLRVALAERGVALSSTQVEYSAAHLQPLRDGTFDAALAHQEAVLAWSPLAGGRLVDGSDVPAGLVATLDDLATTYGSDRATVALAFVLAHPVAPVAIVGSQDPDRLARAGDATTVPLTRTDCYRIVAASEGRPLP